MVALFAFLLSLPQATSACDSVLPLYPGRTWIYSGTVVWTPPGATASDSGPVSWTMAVGSVRHAGPARLALVQGFLQELAWWEPGRRPRLSLLVCRGATLSVLGFEQDSLAIRAYENWDEGLLRLAEVWLETPLHEGRILGQDPPRDDHFYGWLVGPAEDPSGLPGSCRGGAGSRYLLAYRSLPDHRLVEWQAGVGITRFIYGHHGTPASADVRLIDCRES